MLIDVFLPLNCLNIEIITQLKLLWSYAVFLFETLPSQHFWVFYQDLDEVSKGFVDSKNCIMIEF